MNANIEAYMNIIRNFRPLASGIKNKDGKMIKPNTIFRSGFISEEMKSDILELKKLQIKTIYDLRNDHEIKRDFRIEGIEIKHFAVPQPHIGKFTTEFLLEAAEKGVDDIVLPFYSDILIKSDVIQNAFKSIILDFGEDEIINEYLILDQRIVEDGNQSVRNYHKLDEEVVAKLEPMHKVNARYLKALFNQIELKYQNVNNYLLEHFGITDSMIETFKSNYLV